MLTWLARQGIQGRLLLIFSSLILLGALGIGAGVAAVSRLADFVERGLRQEAVERYYGELDRLLLQQELTLYRFALDGDQAYLRQYNNLKISLDHNFRLILNSDIDGASAANLRRIAADLENLHRQVDELLSQPGLDGGVQPDALDAHSQAYAGLRQRLQDASSQRRQVMLTSVDEIRGLAAQILLGGAGVLVVFVLFVVLVALVVDDLSGPLLTLTASMKAYQNGSFQPAMLQRYLNRGDELGLLADSLNQLIDTIQEQKQSQDRLLASLSRFFPGVYLDLLQKSSIEQIQLGDHISAEMAVLFSDIRSFTTISEKMTPIQNFSLVNNYLKLVSPVVEQNNGFIVKFLGDGIMAVFPYRVEDALQAAIAKLRLVAKSRKKIQPANLPALEVGIGIHTGHMMVGMIGDEHRLQGDAFSDNVNLTARIESLTRFFQVSLIISAETLSRLEAPGRYQIRPLGLVQVKGRDKPISLFEVFDADPPELRKAKQDTLAAYEAAIKAYRLGHFEAAAAAFERILQVFPQDHPSALFLDRAHYYLANGVPPNWEGVEVMESK
jgi:class 3 adenylate cyclase